MKRSSSKQNKKVSAAKLSKSTAELTLQIFQRNFDQERPEIRTRSESLGEEEEGVEKKSK